MEETLLLSPPPTDSDLVLTPTEFFNKMKINVDVIDNEELKNQYITSFRLLEKAVATGQIRQIKRLQFLISTIKREQTIRGLGLNRYVLSKDVRLFIDKVDKRVVKVTDLEEYPREIPDDIVQEIIQYKSLLDDLLILFTDYTDEVGQAIEKDNRDKDPILFGVYYDELDDKIHERMYFIADWEDEYCDLTLSELIKEFKDIENKDILKYLDKSTSEEIDKAAKELLKKDFESKNRNKNYKVVKESKKESLFSKFKKKFGNKNERH